MTWLGLRSCSPSQGKGLAHVQFAPRSWRPPNVCKCQAGDITLQSPQNGLFGSVWLILEPKGCFPSCFRKQKVRSVKEEGPHGIQSHIQPPCVLSISAVGDNCSSLSCHQLSLLASLTPNFSIHSHMLQLLSEMITETSLPLTFYF